MPAPPPCPAPPRMGGPVLLGATTLGGAGAPTWVSLVKTHGLGPPAPPPGALRALQRRVRR